MDSAAPDAAARSALATLPAVPELEEPELGSPAAEEPAPELELAELELAVAAGIAQVAALLAEHVHPCWTTSEDEARALAGPWARVLRILGASAPSPWVLAAIATFTWAGPRALATARARAGERPKAARARSKAAEPILGQWPPSGPPA